MPLIDSVPPATKAKVRVAVFVYTLLAVSFVQQMGFSGPTPASRLALMFAISLNSRLCINEWHERTSDKALSDGNYYSDKAPGTVALGLPAFLLANRILLLASVRPNSEPGWLVSSWVACAGSLAIVTALAALALFFWLSRWVPRRCALLTALAVTLGAAPLPYSTMMFSHALVAGCIAIGIWALTRGQDGGPLSPTLSTRRGEGGRTEARAKRWDVMAGLALGWALASEYSAGLVVVGVAVFLLGEQWRRYLWLGLGALPPLLLVPAYSWACLGTPFKLPYSYQASFPEMQEGLYAIKWPDAETAFNLLFSTERGLFFWSPFLLLGWVGCFFLAQRSWRMFLLCYIVPVLHIVVISGRVWDWPAGPTLSARLLTPIIPLLALPCALAVQRFPKIGATLAAYSIALITLATLTDACPPFDIGNPLTNLHIPLFLQGKFSPNLGMVLGLPPYASVGLYYAILIGGIWWLWRQLPADGSRTSTAVDERAHSQPS